MKNAPRQSEIETQKRFSFLAILQWLVNFVRLTDEEQNAAGIYFGNPYDRNDDTSMEK
ncbi:MAG: hypothetical protein IPG80_00995 [Anaerolineales bacterium]|jgi:hypothetical protein|uniref:hypothetical protein n=1 Tax=Candidatus Villigracilis vicinus TaxID=3140679 RepID=UPI00313554CE|nr:hypothetical protein [Anaerolineales bacterium]MBK7450648.1 hypothetical protein [Anaerolineales bacterium]MBK9782192.1 hypothetical protein [Anaerolineales bacterium]